MALAVRPHSAGEGPLRRGLLERRRRGVPQEGAGAVHGQGADREVPGGHLQAVCARGPLLVACHPRGPLGRGRAARSALRATRLSGVLRRWQRGAGAHARAREDAGRRRPGAGGAGLRARDPRALRGAARAALGTGDMQHQEHGRAQQLQQGPLPPPAPAPAAAPAERRPLRRLGRRPRPGGWAVGLAAGVRCGGDAEPRGRERPGIQ
mmetsp:Transcript_40690/g.113040  ORF Transcript_40690/g.113040 Transcript_40690/m.113040 type:complete len:208 (-) Transcript_40690:992-1615(-)